MRYSQNISMLLLLTLLVGCSGTAPRDLKPWEASQGASSSRASSSGAKSVKPEYGPKLSVGEPYTVKRGDTLYAIAFRLGIDFRQLAARNGIKSPYTISVGQVLATSKPVVVASGQSRARGSASAQANSGTQSSKPKSKSSSSKGTATKAVSKPASSATPKTKSVARTASKPQKKSASKSVEPNRPVSRWRWPSRGKVIRTFAANVHKGIDIAGNRGDPVTSAAAGKVVYAGAGVTGYGSLIIVKHNDTYLSAYGHNERLLVSEGSVVNAGQQIATMGSSGTNSVKLHFELRRQGKPVDPLTLLPKR
jgi:lipoprotein NlpD